MTLWQRLATLSLPVTLALLSIGGSCGNDPSGSDGPVCEEPAYDPDTRTALLLVDMAVDVDIAPDFTEADHEPAEVSLISGTLPPGMGVDDVNQQISGTPTVTGSYPLVVQALVNCPSGDTYSAQLDLTIEVVDACPQLFAAPTASLAFNLNEDDCKGPLIAGGLGELTCTMTGDLPDGLAFDPVGCEFCGAPTETGQWSVDVHVEDECPQTQAVDIACDIVVTEPGSGPPLGVYTCAQTGEEGIWVEPTVSFGSLQAPYLLCAGDNQWGAFSLRDPFFATLESRWMYPVQANGVCPVAGGPDGSGDYADKAIFAYGPNGGLFTRWDSGSGDFGFSLAINGAEITDACPYGGVAESGGLCYARGGTQLAFIEYDASSGQFGYAAPPIPASSLPGGDVIRSGCVSSITGSALLICDGSPGTLFLHDRANVNADAVVVGQVGDQPLRVREAGGIVCVGNYLDGTLDVGTWVQSRTADRSDVVTLTDQASVGAGPFGIDMLELGDGSVAIACGGYEDNSYSVTVVSAAGAVLSSTTTALPAGVEGPGHVAWLRDGSGHLLVAGNLTSNIAVVDGGL